MLLAGMALYIAMTLSDLFRRALLRHRLVRATVAVFVFAAHGLIPFIPHAPTSEESSARRVRALWYRGCLPQLLDHQEGVAVHRFGVVFKDLYGKAVPPDGRIDIHGH